MALQYVGGTTSSFAGTSTGTINIVLDSLSGGIESSPRVGDLIIVNYAVAGPSDRRSFMAITPGFTSLVNEYPGSAATYETSHVVAYKFFATVGTDATITVQRAGGTTSYGAVVIHVWRGVDKTTPIDVEPVLFGQSTTGTVTATNPNAITPVTAGAQILVIGASASAGATLYTNSYASNFITVAYTAGTYDAVAGIGSVEWTSGTYDPPSFVGGSGGKSSASWSVATIALRPAPPSYVEPIQLLENDNNFFPASVTPGPSRPVFVGGVTIGFLGASVSGTKKTVSIGSLTGGTNSSPSVGDTVVVVYAANSNTDRRSEMTIASGDGITYTDIASLFSGPDSTSKTSLRVAYLTLTSTNESVILGNILSGTGSALTASIHVWRGIDPINPIDVTPITGTWGTGEVAPDLEFPAITPVTPGATILAAGAGGGIAVLYSSPDLQNFLTSKSDAVYDSVNGIGSYPWGGSGSYTPATWTGGSSGYTGGRAWAVFALRPVGSADLQTITPSLATNTQTFYGPTAAAGAVGLSPSPLSSSQSLFSPTISRGAVKLVASRLASLPEFYSPKLNPGALSLAAPIIYSFGGFFPPSITYDAAVDLSGAGLFGVDVGAPILEIKQLLIGGASAKASTAVMLANDKFIAGFGSGAFSASGSVSKLDALSANVSEVLLSTSELSLQNPVTANVLVGSLAVGTLDATGLSLLSGDASLQAVIAGGLTKSSSLFGPSSTTLAVSAYARITKPLVGGAFSSTLVSAAAGVGTILSSSASASVQAAAALTILPLSALSGSILGTSTVNAVVAVQKPFRADAGASATVSGSLDVGALVLLSGSAAAMVDTATNLTNTSVLFGSAVCSSSALSWAVLDCSLFGELKADALLTTTLFITKGVTGATLAASQADGRLVRLIPVSFGSVLVKVKVSQVEASLLVGRVVATVTA